MTERERSSPSVRVIGPQCHPRSAKTYCRSVLLSPRSCFKKLTPVISFNFLMPHAERIVGPRSVPQTSEVEFDLGGTRSGQRMMRGTWVPRSKRVPLPRSNASPLSPMKITSVLSSMPRVFSTFMIKPKP